MAKNPEIPLHLFQILEEEYANLYGSPHAQEAPAEAEETVSVWLPERGAEGDEAPEGSGGAAWRVVEAGRDWRFRPGHLSEAAGLAAEIRRDDAPASSAAQSHVYDEWAKENLWAHLRKLMDEKVLEEAAAGRGAIAAARSELSEARRALDAALAERESILRDIAKEARGGKVRSPDTPPQARGERLAELEQAQAELEQTVARLRQQRDTSQRQLDALDGPLRRELDKLLDNRGLYSSERFPARWLTPMVEGLVALHESSALEGDALRQLNRLLLESAFPKHIERIHHIRVAAVVQQLHESAPAALSLSGGGIRSGTFALGLLQGLARHDLLKEFDYLSTVSGGGYIGGWLTAWLHRHPEGLAGVTRDLSNRSPVSKLDPDPRPIRHLREYSNFLTPKVGALTADTWTFVGIYLRNLLLNWAVFLPLLLALLMLPRLLVTYTLYQPTEDAQPAAGVMRIRPEELDLVPGMKEVPERLRVVYQPAPHVKNFFDLPVLRQLFVWSREEDRGLYPRHVLLMFGLLLGVWALGYVGFNRPALRETLRERSKFWRDRADQRGFLVFCLLPLVISAALLTTYWAWTQEASSAVKGLGYFLGFGLAFTLGGWLVASLVLRRLWRYKGAWRFREISLREVLSAVGAGLLGGLLFWVVALFEFDSPLKGYGVVVHKEGAGEGPAAWAVAGSPLAWTDWTRWGWTGWTTELYVCTAVPIFLLVLWAGVALFVGLTSQSPKVSDEDREWWARFGAWLLIVCIGWVVLSAAVIFGPLALLEFPRLLGAVGGLSGLIAVLVGRSSLMPAREGATDEKNKSKAGAATRLVGGVLPLFGLVFLLSVVAALSLLTTGLTRWVALNAPAICDGLGVDRFGAGFRILSWGGGVQLVPHDFEEFITNVPKRPPYKGFGIEPAGGEIDSYLEFITPVVPTTVKPLEGPTPLPGEPLCVPVCPPPAEAAQVRSEHTLDSYGGAKIVHLNVLHHTSHWFTLALALLTFGLGMLLSWLINLNYFSLHNGYRNRLIRAFLGASRPPGQRKPNPFTGFDTADNIHMHELRPALLDEDDILDQSALYDALLNQSNELSSYLAERELLKTVRNESGSTPSPSLVTALRTDLNAIMESQALYLERSFADKYLKGAAGRIVARVADECNSPDLREVYGSYRILLNRLVLECAYPKTLRPCRYPPPPYKLLHVVNTSLNLVGGEKLAWQQRKAEPFSVTPLHAGCYRLGYRRSRVYGGKKTGGISLGTAAAISGAAASSNMGYYTTSPIISLLLTLFNVRLGWWLGNPGPAGQDTYQLGNPKFSISPIVYEAFGLTNDRYKYVYLTDGGHFENLGLYEMVLRRCHVIVVSDGAEDQKYRFGDLGNAVRKIRIDLGIPIDFPCLDIYGWEKAQEKRSQGKGPWGMYWAVGRIRYSCVDKVGANDGGSPVPADDGILIYIKPALYGDEPRDVLEYRENFPAFPHQSTGDQFFDESQFESYRMLGSFIMDQLCGSAFQPLTLAGLVGKAFAGTAAHCPEDFGGQGVVGAPGAAGTEDERFEAWLEKLNDKSYQSWLRELADAGRA